MQWSQNVLQKQFQRVSIHRTIYELLTIKLRIYSSQCKGEFDLTQGTSVYDSALVTETIIYLQIPPLPLGFSEEQLKKEKCNIWLLK